KDSNGIPVFPFGQDPFPEGLSTRELENILANLPASAREVLEKLARRQNVSPEKKRNLKDSVIKGYGSFIVLLADPVDVLEFEVEVSGDIVRLDPLKPVFHVMRGAWLDVLLLLLKGRLLAWRQLDFDVDWEDTASFYGMYVFKVAHISGREYFDQSLFSPVTPTEYERVNMPKQPRTGLPGNVMGTQANGHRTDEKVLVSSLSGVRFSARESLQIADIVPSFGLGVGSLLPDSGDSVIRRNMIVIHEADAAERDRRVAEWSQAADQGDLLAQYTLAYFYSQQTPPDNERAFAVYRQAAEQAEAASPSSQDMFENGSAAQCCLADMYERGVGTVQDDRQALYWYTRAATAGNHVAQYRLGMRYMNGHGVMADKVQARFWVSQSVEQRYEKATNLLRNFPTFEGAEQGNKVAQYLLGQMYAEGYGGVEKDAERARHWYTKSAVQGHAGAQYEVGKNYIKDSTVPPDLADARHWLSKAATQRDQDAKRLLRDTDVWVAAKKQNIRAMYDLACLYQQWENYPHAVYWYRKVVEQVELLPSSSSDMFENGSAAQCNLAEIYEHGHGVPQDDVQALYWYSKSAAMNNRVAQYSLGMMYLNGRGVPKSVEQARVWLLQSAMEGYEDARTALQTIAKTP
ncbi:MAG: tetratricopeptide repeat protein, partial [Pseudomonadota bacterium]